MLVEVCVYCCYSEESVKGTVSESEEVAKVLSSNCDKTDSMCKIVLSKAVDGVTATDLILSGTDEAPETAESNSRKSPETQNAM